MTLQIRLQKRDLAHLERIREIGQAALRQVIVELSKLPVAPCQPEKLHDSISEALDGDVQRAEVLLRQLLSLNGMRRQLNLRSDEVFLGLDSGLRRGGWGQEELAKWESVSGIFKELFDLPIVRLSAKALDLSYQHTHLFERAQIITDIRPVFNDDATEIQGTVVSHKLLLRYHDSMGTHELSLAVDKKDIEALIQQCNRALKKSETVKVQL
jgi:hypothetical protein